MSTTLKVGDVVGIVKLKKTYDAYFHIILGRYIKEIYQPRVGTRRLPAKFEILSVLPDKKEYNRRREAYFTVSLEQLVDKALSITQELGEELREWYDNLNEFLQTSDKALTLAESADALESIDVCSRPKHYERITTVHYPALDAVSRAARAAEAREMFYAVSQAARAYVDNPGTDTTNLYAADGSLIKLNTDELLEFADNCDDAARELENVEFPGMCG